MFPFTVGLYELERSCLESAMLQLILHIQEQQIWFTNQI